MYVQGVLWMYFCIYVHDMALTASLGLALPLWARNSGCGALAGAGNGFTAQLPGGAHPLDTADWGVSGSQGVWVSEACVGGKIGG